MKPIPPRAAFAAMILATSCMSARATDCACGPTYCVDTPAYKTALVQKKKALAANHPAHLIPLFDKLDRCEAAITTAPDGFQIFRQSKDGSIGIDSWTKANEKNGAAAVKNGSLKMCRVIIVRHALACCGAKPYDKRADYDAMLDLNTTATASCTE